MSDEQYSHAFKDAVPDAPNPNGWADGARRRRRRRGQLLAGAVGAVVVALAIPVGVNLASRNVVATPAEPPVQVSVTPDPAPDSLPGAAACFGADGQLLQVTEGDGIESGAVKAWLCGDGSVVGPLEPLVTDVDRIVDFVSAQETLPPDVACTAEYRLAYTVVLEYADGTRKPVMGELHGCRTINDGATVRTGGAEFYSLVRGLWKEQRLGTAAPEVAPPVTGCPVAASMLTPDLGHIQRGVICIVADTAGGMVQFDDASAARIGADIKANAVKGEPAAWAGPGTTLTLIGPWGDTLTLNPHATGYWFVDADGAMWLWTPSPDVQALLDGIPVPVGPTPTDAPASPDQPAAPGEGPSAPTTAG